MHSARRTGRINSEGELLSGSAIRQSHLVDDERVRIARPEDFLALLGQSDDRQAVETKRLQFA